MREFLPRTQEHHRTDATASILHRKMGALAFVALRLSECKKLSRRGSKEYFVKTMRKIRGTVRKMHHTSRLDSTTGSKTRADPKRHSLHTTGIYHADHGTYIDSVLREIYDAYKAARSTPSTCNGGPADHVPKRQFDLATRMML